MKKEVVVHTVDCYSVIKTDKIVPFLTTQMNLEDIMLSEISKTEEDKYHMSSQISKQTKQYQKLTENRLR